MPKVEVFYRFYEKKKARTVKVTLTSSLNLKLYRYHNVPKLSICFHKVKAKLVRFVHNWPPARRSYAPEGMMEQWNSGIMGSGLRLREDNAMFD